MVTAAKVLRILQVRFLIAGVFNTAFSYALYAALLFALGQGRFQTALFLSWAISTLPSFAVQRRWVFKSGGAWGAQYVKSVGVWALSYAINAVFLQVLAGFLNPYLAQIISLTAATANTYLLFRYYTFKHAKK